MGTRPPRQARSTVAQAQEQAEADGADFFTRACDYAQEKKNRAIREGRLATDDMGNPVWRNPRFAEKANGWIDARTASLRKKFKRGDGEIMSNRPQAGVYGSYAAVSLGRGAGSLAQHFASGLEVAAGAAAAGALGGPFSLLSAGPLAKDALKVESTIDKAKRSLVDKLDGAQAYMTSIKKGQEPKPDDARAYLAFRAAAKKVKTLNRSVAKEQRRTNANALRSAPVQVTNGALRIGRDIGTTSHTVGGTVAGSLGVASSLLSIANGSLYCYIASIEHGKAHQQKEVAKTMQEKLKAFGRHPHVCLDDSIRRIMGNLDTNLTRLHRQGVRDRRYADMRMMRGIADIAVGSALAGVGIAALVGVSVATAGAALGVVAAVVAGTYLGAVAGKFHHKWKGEHTSKRRQRHAQMLIATIPGDQLRRHFIGRERTSLTAILAAYQQNNLHLGREVVKDREVDIGSNEYVALHFLAQDLLAELVPGADVDGAAHQGSGAASRILSVLGMDKSELHTLAVALRKGETEEKRLEFVKKMIAPVVGVPFRINGKGEEEEGALKVFREKSLTSQEGGDAEQRISQTSKEESSSLVGSSSSSSSRVASWSGSDSVSLDGRARKSEQESGFQSEDASHATNDAEESSEELSVSMSQSAVPLSVSSSANPGLSNRF